jgi:hypothetical protein
MNVKLTKALDRASNKTLAQIAFLIRSAADYQQAVDHYRAEMKRLSPQTIGHKSAFEDLKLLPVLMTGYKEKFILQTF